jgi:hypothetical protein
VTIVIGALAAREDDLLSNDRAESE